MAKSPISFKKTYDSTEERIKPVSNPHVRSHVVERDAHGGLQDMTSVSVGSVHNSLNVLEHLFLP